MQKARTLKMELCANGVSKVVAQQMLFQVKCRGDMQTEQF